MKSVSVLLILSFLFQETSFANPDLSKLEVRSWKLEEKNKNLHWARQLLPPIPESIATLEDAWRAEGNKQKAIGNKTIILLQDAHTNDSGQMSLAKTLDILFQSQTPPNALFKKSGGISYVFLEAGFGNDSLSFLRQYSSLEERKKVALSYLRKGILHGEEYLDLTSNHNFTLWGVEDINLYMKALEAYRYTATQRTKFEDYLNKIDNAIKTLKPRILNPWTLSFDKSYNDYLEGKTSLEEHFKSLLIQAELHDIPLKNYPNFRKLKSLKNLEQTIDFNKANLEQRKLSIASLTEHPELSKYLCYLKRSKKLNPQELLKEQKALENQVFDSLIQTPDEQTLLKCSKELRLLRKLFSFTLTPEEYEDYKELISSFSPSPSPSHTREGKRKI